MRTTNDIFKEFENLTVLIVGDVMIDRYLSGNINRISPEAPVPVVHLQNSENRLGGAANVALNIKALGANPILCSVIGKDEFGSHLLDILPKHGITTKGIIQSDNRVTTVKTRVIASNQHILRVDTEDTHDLDNKERQRLLNNIVSIIESKSPDVILFQDYNKGVLSEQIISDIMLIAVKQDIKTVVDPKLKNFFAYKKATLFKPNLKEVKDAININFPKSNSFLHNATQYLREKAGVENIIITLGEKGMYINDGKLQVSIPTQARDIADVCGAGDTVVSVAALGIGIEMSLENIAILANLAGGIVCEQVGVVPIDLNQLKEEYTKLISHSNFKSTS